jgi:DNA-binding IclR family transcriptional regulator
MAHEPDERRIKTMAHTYEELKKKTLAQLREITAGIDHEAVQGYTQLNKEHLLQAICKALGIDMHVHHQVVGLNKTEIKAKIKELKQKREQAIAAHDHTELKNVRRSIHHMKRMLHKATV